MRPHPAKQALKEAGVSQGAVARRAGVARETVTHALSPNHHATVSPRIEAAMRGLLEEAGWDGDLDKLFGRQVATPEAVERRRSAQRRFLARNPGYGAEASQRHRAKKAEL